MNIPIAAGVQVGRRKFGYMAAAPWAKLEQPGSGDAAAYSTMQHCCQHTTGHKLVCTLVGHNNLMAASCLQQSDLVPLTDGSQVFLNFWYRQHPESFLCIVPDYPNFNLSSFEVFGEYILQSSNGSLHCFIIAVLWVALELFLQVVFCFLVFDASTGRLQRASIISKPHVCMHKPNALVRMAAQPRLL